MPFKDLLVHLDASRQGAERLDYAIEWATRDRAHLTGLYTLDLAPTLAELARAYPGPVEHFETYVQLRTTAVDRAKEVEGRFHGANSSSAEHPGRLSGPAYFLFS
jgi:nucleotide-binding universal stress UspA family protein